MENDEDKLYVPLDMDNYLLGAIRSPSMPPPRKPLEPVTEKNHIKYLGCGSIKEPEPSDWECELFGTKLSIIPNKGDEPNWFNRLMQRICFGFKWKNIKVNE